MVKLYDADSDTAHSGEDGIKKAFMEVRREGDTPHGSKSMGGIISIQEPSWCVILWYSFPVDTTAWPRSQKIALAVFNNVPGAISETMLHKTKWLHHTYLVGVPTLNTNHNCYITSPVGVRKAPRYEIGNTTPAFSGSRLGWNQNGYITVALWGSQ